MQGKLNTEIKLPDNMDTLKNMRPFTIDNPALTIETNLPEEVDKIEYNEAFDGDDTISLTFEYKEDAGWMCSFSYYVDCCVVITVHADSPALGVRCLTKQIKQSLILRRLQRERNFDVLSMLLCEGYGQECNGLIRTYYVDGKPVSKQLIEFSYVTETDTYKAYYNALHIKEEGVEMDTDTSIIDELTAIQERLTQLVARVNGLGKDGCSENKDGCCGGCKSRE